MGSFLDDAMMSPKLIKRRKQRFIAMDTSVIDLLTPQKFSLRLVKDIDGAYFTENDLVDDIIGFGSTKQEAIASFKEDLAAFAALYFDDYHTMVAAPNRREQLPYALKARCHIEKYGNLDRMVDVVD
jgi:hypothetical protein